MGVGELSRMKMRRMGWAFECETYWTRIKTDGCRDVRKTSDLHHEIRSPDAFRLVIDQDLDQNAKKSWTGDANSLEARKVLFYL